MKKILIKIALVSLFAALLVPATAFAKGPIVIKTLPYTISVPGNYTLAANLTYTANLVDAITISASNVTLDMNGFGITGPAAHNGITVTGNGVEVRNGFITGFYYGLHTSGIGTKALNLMIYDNWVGMFFNISGYCAMIKGCIISGNYTDGIRSYASGIITDNVVYNNVSLGIYANQSCVIGNSCYDNGTGIVAGAGCTVKNNSSCNNTCGIQTIGTVLLDGNAAYGNTNANYSLSAETVPGHNTP